MSGILTAIIDALKSMSIIPLIFIALGIFLLLSTLTFYVIGKIKYKNKQKCEFELIQDYTPIIVSNKRIGYSTQYRASFSVNKPIKNLCIVIDSFSCWEDETIEYDDFSKNKLIFAEETKPNIFYEKEIFVYRSDTREFSITFMGIKRVIQLTPRYTYSLELELMFDKVTKENFSYLITVDSDNSINLRRIPVYKAGAE